MIELNWASRSKENMQSQLVGVAHATIQKEAQERVLKMLTEVFPPALRQVKSLFAASGGRDRKRIRGIRQTVKAMASRYSGSYIGTALKAALEAATPEEGKLFDPYDTEMATFDAKGRLATSFQLIHSVYIQRGISEAPAWADQFKIKFAQETGQKEKKW